MALYWKKRSPQERQLHIQEALKQNVNFATDASLGYPASKLDTRVFPGDASFLKDAPLLQTLVANPNHIGCHTLGTSEYAFKGTQAIEREVLDILAVDVFQAQTGSFDGYISPGGTEANIQALWMYRNYFLQKYQARREEIAILASEDTHYSIAKGANLLFLDKVIVPVHPDTRQLNAPAIAEALDQAQADGKKYFIVVANMGTTMFGSVDNAQLYLAALKQRDLPFQLHIDAAYGGFVYPFSNPQNPWHFGNPEVSSITVDAHKMLQAPYGTGIFLCRKGLIERVLTREAEYIEGFDLTLCGSRSGANAVAVWLILATYGPHGWAEKIGVLQNRTRWFCEQLNARQVAYFREPFMNIVTLSASAIPEEVASRFQLVPQKHQSDNQWYKVVLMDHVEMEHLEAFLEALDNHLAYRETYNAVVESPQTVK